VVEALKLTVALTVISLLAGLAIGYTNEKTAPRIAQQRAHRETQAIRAVLPHGVQVAERRGRKPLPQRYWAGLSDGREATYAFIVRVESYDPYGITFAVGVDTAGTILGVRVLDQQETPGLGSRVVEVASTDYIWRRWRGPPQQNDPWFTDQFRGIDIRQRIELERSAEWHALSERERLGLRRRNAVTAITGATISSRAVARGLESAVFNYVRALRKVTTP
jgi:electron transport complex protein RnfG